MVEERIPMAMRQSIAVHEDQRREALIQATYLEVAEKGYSAVTLQDIANRAGVSKGATLYYFASKEELFLGALEWMVRRHDSICKQAIENAPNPVEKLKALIGAIFGNPQEARQFLL